MGRRAVRFQEDGREWELPSLFYTDYLVLCGESEEHLRATAGWFVEVGRRIALKVNEGKNDVRVLNGVEGLEYEVHVNEICLEHVSELK